jgi:hypothetical protein
MTSEVSATDFNKLQNISAFLKGEECYHPAADPKNAKLVQ